MYAIRRCRFEVKSTFRYKNISRTFWIRGYFQDTHEQRVSVILSTPSSNNISFAIKLFEVADFSSSPTLMKNSENSSIIEKFGGVLDQLNNTRHDTEHMVARNIAAHSPVFYYVDLKGG